VSRSTILLKDHIVIIIVTITTVIIVIIGLRIKLFPMFSADSSLTDVIPERCLSSRLLVSSAVYPSDEFYFRVVALY
jgi:hypothetical protein